MKYAPLSIASRDDADDAGSRDDAEEDEEAPEDATMTPLARGDDDGAATGGAAAEPAAPRDAEAPAKEDETQAQLLRRLAFSVYLPWAALNFGASMTKTVLPGFASEELKLRPALVGATVAAAGLGRTLFNVPAGRLAARYGDARVCALGHAMGAAAAAVTAFAYDVRVLALATTLGGAGSGAAQIAMQSFVRASVPNARRGRVMGLVGGVARVASSVGPAVAGGAWAFETSGREACTHFLARLRSSSLPRISSVSECSKRSRSAPDTRAIFSLV